MKVLYYHQYFSTPDGAAGTRSHALARSLVEAGHQVQMVCLRDARTHTGLSGPFAKGQRRGLVDGVEVIEFDLPYSNHAGLLERALVFLRYSWQSLQLALRSDADLLFATTTPLTAGIPGIAARWLRGTPFVFEVRDLWPELPRAMGVVRNPLVLAALSALEWLSYYSADACIGLAPGICEGIAERGISPSRITSIPNACDLELFNPLPQGAAKQPNLIGGLHQRLSPSSFVAAFTGAHGLANGLDAVLDAAAVLKRLGRSDIQLLFIGDGRCKTDMERRVAAEGLSNCHFLPPIPKPKLAQTLQQSVHVGLMVLDDIPAFYRGTSPNKFFDYLACGLPVVNNYPGWLAELISEQQLGIPVSPRDPAAFAAALIRLADQPALVSTMGTNARALAESRFSRLVLADQWRHVLETTSARYACRRHRYLGQQVYALFKGLGDRLTALLALLLLSPLLLVIGALVHFRLGAPVLFRQQRPGYLGRPFWLLKFRIIPIVRLRFGDWRTITYVVIKGMADRAVALVSLLFFSPLLLGVALLVWWRLGVPVLFRQERLGYSGSPFKLLKFRTMSNARDDAGSLLPDDQRLTLFGKFLRLTSIDELPSLLNVLRGEMSLVGPRPFVIKIEDYDPDFLSRFDCRPGLTGWAQINGRNSISWSQKFKLDCWYVANRGIFLDLYIILLTPLVLVSPGKVSALGHVTSPVYIKNQT